MSQDTLSDALNEIMNAIRAKKQYILVAKNSSLLIKILDLMKQYGYIDYEKQEKHIKITIMGITECKAIKPRYAVAKTDIDKYMRRFLPARDFGFLIISTSKGLMTHKEAQENKIGGSLIAYFY